MNFRPLIFIVVVLVSQHATAQLLVGPVAGGNYSWATFADKDLKDTYKTAGVFGFHAGAELSFQVKKRFFLQTSIVYSTKGRTMTTDKEEQFSFKTQYNFIEMPIIYSIDFKVKTSNSREFKYFLGVGPNLSYWLGGKGTLVNGDLMENNVNKLDYRIVFKSKSEEGPADNEMLVDANRFQLGLNIAAGVVFEPANRQRVMVTMRYELGHTYLAKSPGTLNLTYFQDPLQSRNQGFRLSVAYLYDLKTSDRNKGKSTIDHRRPK
jgi:hypothetical protein